MIFSLFWLISKWWYTCTTWFSNVFFVFFAGMKGLLVLAALVGIAQCVSFFDLVSEQWASFKVFFLYIITCFPFTHTHTTITFVCVFTICDFTTCEFGSWVRRMPLIQLATCFFASNWIIFMLDIQIWWIMITRDILIAGRCDFRWPQGTNTLQFGPVIKIVCFCSYDCALFTIYNIIHIKLHVLYLHEYKMATDYLFWSIFIAFSCNTRKNMTAKQKRSSEWRFSWRTHIK